jgi:hypothetical protein
MKLKQITFAIAAILSIGAAGAATININGTEATGTLGSMTVDSSGNVSITSTGSMTYPSSGGTTPPPSASAFTIGGSVTGLPTSTSVVLKNNNLDTVSVTADGSFTFPTTLSYSSGYNVTVATQPAGANCTLSNGSGTVNNSNVTNVAVACTTTTAPPPPATGSCGAKPSNVTIGTPVRGATYPLGGDIYSFPLTVVPGNNNYSANYQGYAAQKIVWISTCPGQVDGNGLPVPVAPTFYTQGYQTANLLVAGVDSTTPNMTYKQLTNGTQYYFNVRNATTASPTVNSCPAGTNCSFVLGWPN